MTSGLEMFRDMLSVLGEKPESWKLEHQTAMACRDLEDILSAFNALFGAIRQAGRRDSEQSTQEHAARYESIENLYRQWRDAGLGVQSRIQWLSQSDYTVEGSEEFLSNLAEAEKFLGNARRAAIMEERTGLRDRTLTPEAAEQLTQILDGRAGTSFRPIYEPKSVPLVDIPDGHQRK
jgi:hypothetical protein